MNIAQDPLVQWLLTMDVVYEDCKNKVLCPIINLFYRDSGSTLILKGSVEFFFYF